MWFEGREAASARSGAPAPSEQACALMLDLQATFCAGAWAAVVILSAAIVDSQGREARALTGSKDVPGVARSELRWLRDLRNRLVHEDRTKPVLTVDDQWLRRDRWERHARRAVEAAFAALYPGTAEEGRAVERW